MIPMPQAAALRILTHWLLQPAHALRGKDSQVGMDTTMDAMRKKREQVCRFHGCSCTKIHARDLCRAHHQKYRRIIAATKNTSMPVTWDDLVALGKCGESRQGPRDADFRNRLVEEVRSMRKATKRVRRVKAVA